MDEIETFDFTPSDIMEFLIYFQNKPFPLRELAVDYYRENREDIAESTNYEPQACNIYRKESLYLPIDILLVISFSVAFGQKIA
jgi:hypothetical protein